MSTGPESGAAPTPAGPVPEWLVPERLVPDSSDPFVADLLGRCDLPPTGTAVTCAVSGGADSTALVALAVAAGLRVDAVHVDHALRGGSEAESQRIAEVLSAWAVPLRSVRAEVVPGGDLEARARAARHAALPPDALFGHTAEDQAETVLVRLLRGTGPTGLAAMRPDRHPLLRLRRAETRALCAHLGIDPIEDPTNDDARFVRNRVRHELLPLLDDIAARDVVPLLCRLAELSADQADLLDVLAAAVDPTDVGSLALVPAPVAAAALRTWWISATGADHPPDAAALTRMLDVAAGRATGCDVVGGWSLRRTAGRLRLERALPDGRTTPSGTALSSAADER